MQFSSYWRATTWAAGVLKSMEHSDSKKRSIDGLEIRECREADNTAIESLYPQAFPDEDLLPVVRGLLADTKIALSLVGVIDSHVVSHVAFTRCGVTDSCVKVSLLAPLAVAPAWQRCGVGTAIVRAGLQRQRDEGVQVVFVLGDPAYYGRLGFAAESRIEPPYPLPPEWQGAWQSQLLDHQSARLAGKLVVPALWDDAALWAP